MFTLLEAKETTRMKLERVWMQVFLLLNFAIKKQGQTTTVWSMNFHLFIYILLYFGFLWSLFCCCRVDVVSVVLNRWDPLKIYGANYSARATTTTTKMSCRFTTLDYLLCTKNHLCHSILEVYLGIFFLLLLPRPVKTAPNFKTPPKKAKKLTKQVTEEETWKSNLL